jgi:type I restriction enzyme, R subunit
LRIFTTSPTSGGKLPLLIKEMMDKLKLGKPYFAPFRIWQAYEQLEKVNGNSPKNKLTAFVSLIRRITEVDPVLTSYDQTVNRNFQEWVLKK